MRPPNALRGDFAAVLAGERVAFDTALRTVALIEERCGGVPIVRAIEAAVFGRRAADTQALIAGALGALGREDAEAVAARTSVAEGEAFVLALMAALGFEVARRAAGESAPAPFPAAPDAPRSGGAGAASPSVPCTGPRRGSGPAPGAASPMPGTATEVSSSGQTRTKPA